MNNISNATKLLTTILLLISSPMFASDNASWSGYYQDTGVEIEIGTGNLVRSGLDIEIYDFEINENKTVEVQTIDYIGGGAEIEIYEYETNKYRTLEME